MMLGTVVDVASIGTPGFHSALVGSFALGASEAFGASEGFSASGILARTARTAEGRFDSGEVSAVAGPPGASMSTVRPCGRSSMR